MKVEISNPKRVPVPPSSGEVNLNKLSIFYFNARSILPKMDELKVVVAAQNPSIVCIVETWLCDAISDFEISIKNFQLVRLDRNRHGGGVLIYVHSSLNWDVLLNGPNDLEFLSLSISSPCKLFKHCISVLYRSPSLPVSFFDNFCTTLQFLLPHRFTVILILIFVIRITQFCISW